MSASKERHPAAAPAGGPSWLDRRLDLSAVEPQVWIFLALLLIAVLLRFWDLGARAMHQDEAVHALVSWRFYTGEELYRYNPSTHGPLLYHLTALSYFLFGDGEAATRAPEALFGVLLVALCYPLRRWLGRWTWPIAAALFAFSPVLTYFSRFARHDALVATGTLALVLFLFRYLEERRPGDLLLGAAALALCAASHELTLIIAFILLSFLGLAYLLERQEGRFLTRARLAAAAVVLLGLPAGLGLAALEAAPFQQALLFGLTLLALGYLGLSFLWPWRSSPRPAPLTAAVRDLAADRRTWLAALGVFGVLFGLLFTTFLTNPRGLLDGLIQGLTYWIGQQAAGRGDQPWFYYPMLLALYERLALLAGIGGGVLVVLQARGRHRAVGLPPTPAGAAPAGPALQPLFHLFLVYWALFALLAFSWAGEKMPWLLLHVLLPLLLLAALALGRFARWLAGSWQPFWRSMDWAIAPLFLLLILAVAGLAGVLGGQGQPLAEAYRLAQAAVLSLIALALAALLVWRIAAAEGRHVGQSFVALLLVLLAAYGLRSTFLVNFYFADTPREMLVYTQTAPDVPLVVRQIERLGIDQTRKVRTVADPTGGHGLRVAIDTAGGTGLEVPFDWYLRDFARAGTLLHFTSTATLPPPESDILLLPAETEPLVRPYLQGKYTGMPVHLRWWFPEEATYRRWTLFETGLTSQGYPAIPLFNPLAYTREGFNNLLTYLTYRQLPYELEATDLYYYVRSDLMPAGGTAAPADPYIEKLTQRPAQQVFGFTGSGPGQLLYPRGIAVDAAGNLYVADSGNHRIVRFDATGRATSWGSACILESREGCVDPDGTGPLPLGAGQFNEPWGVATDSAGRVYVADTWNHRLQVFDADGRFLGQWGEGRLTDADLDPRGRAGTPFAFYGPRGVAVDSQGRVYVTDTGNERVLVYALSEGAAGTLQAEYLYQWGTAGPQEGNFLEPVGIVLDAADRVYVADTLNSRIQVFGPHDGQVSFDPVATWKVTGWDSPSRENKPYIAVSPGGQVYFTVPERSYIACTDGKGDILAVWGSYGTGLSAFATPIGVAVDASGRVYVSDSGNGRVLVFAVP